MSNYSQMSSEQVFQLACQGDTDAQLYLLEGAAELIQTSEEEHVRAAVHIIQGVARLGHPLAIEWMETPTIKTIISLM